MSPQDVDVMYYISVSYPNVGSFTVEIFHLPHPLFFNLLQSVGRIQSVVSFRVTVDLGRRPPYIDTGNR